MDKVNKKRKAPVVYQDKDDKIFTVEEPAAAYDCTPPAPWAILTTSHPYTAFDYLENAYQGVPKSAAVQLARTLDVPLKDMAGLLNISYKTFARKKMPDKMDALTSSLTIEVAAIINEGVATFGNIEKLRTWLQKPNLALHNHTPFSLLNTPTGLKMVQQVMGRINEGIYT